MQDRVKIQYRNMSLPRFTCYWSAKCAAGREPHSYSLLAHLRQHERKFGVKIDDLAVMA
jgi:chemotaxis methyl-accepting protein methylase